VDKSRSFKGTLLLGKIWYHVVKVFGDEQRLFESGSSFATGVRGTTFWTLPGGKNRLVVSEGSVWVSHTKGAKLTGKKVIVKKGHTAVITKKKITVRTTTKKDAFPFR
jgi:hypothetical protein